MKENDKAWWSTKITKIEPNKILLRGYRVESLIGKIGYAEILYLMIMGELLMPEKAKLLEAVLVAGCDHGPKAPSVAAARMAATCGISFNSCIATGINVLGDVHGGAGEQAMRLFYSIKEEADLKQESIVNYAKKRCCQMWEKKIYVPGFGHRFHTKDPRVSILYELAEEAEAKGLISGDYMRIAKTIQDEISSLMQKKLAMNIDGVSAAIQCEIGLPADVAKGIFSISRGIGLIAHAYEEWQSGSRVKGPIPPWDDQYYKYFGPEERTLEK